MARGTRLRVEIPGPESILWDILGQLVELEPRLPARPDVARAFGRALLAVDAVRELVPEPDVTRRARGSRPAKNGATARSSERLVPVG